MNNREHPFQQLRAKVTALEDDITSIEERANRQEVTIKLCGPNLDSPRDLSQKSQANSRECKIALQLKPDR